MIFANRSASGTPRRLMPTKARSSIPLFFSTISCASRISVRSISEADISCAFSRISTGRLGTCELINAASYAGGCLRARWTLKRWPIAVAKEHGSDNAAGGRKQHRQENRPRHEQRQHNFEPLRSVDPLQEGLN